MDKWNFLNSVDRSVLFLNVDFEPFFFYSFSFSFFLFSSLSFPSSYFSSFSFALKNRIMDHQIETLSPVSWSDYTTNDQTLLSQLNNFKQQAQNLQLRMDDNQGNTAGAGTDGSHSGQYTSSASPEDHMPNTHMSSPFHSNDVQQTSEFQSFLDFTSAHHGGGGGGVDTTRESFTPSPGATSSSSNALPMSMPMKPLGHHSMNPTSPQNIDVFFNDLFQVYSMDPSTASSPSLHSPDHSSNHNTNRMNHITNINNIDDLLRDSSSSHNSSAATGGSHHDVFRSPLHGPMIRMTRGSSVDLSETISTSSTAGDFTPLLSPAVTPFFDTINPSIMAASEFTMPGSFMEHEQQGCGPSLSLDPKQVIISTRHQEQQQQQQAEPTKKSRRTRKPSTTTVALAPLKPRQGQKAGGGSSVSSSRVVKMSPLARPTRGNLASTSRSKTSSPVISAFSRSFSVPNGNNSNHSRHASCSESVSPEESLELGMAPPSSSSMASQKNVNQAQVPGPESGAVPAATPASLMNLPDRKDVTMTGVSNTESHLQNAVRATKYIAIQEAAAAATPTNGPGPRKTRSQSKTAPSSASASPTMSTTTLTTSSGRPKLLARTGSAKSITSMPSPRLPRLGSANNGGGTMIKPKGPAPDHQHGSPILVAPSWRPTGSISSGSGSGSINKGGNGNSNGNGSRHGSISASPILRPRVSPRISPRISPRLDSSSSSIHNMQHNNKRSSMSGGSNNININNMNRMGHASDLSALLASKSNYQNIVEGNHNQLGLVYPDTLSADLTSKRTSHKIAEQGRRNRINTALADLAKMLSDGGGGVNGSGSRSGDEAATATTSATASTTASPSGTLPSKATTVEMAIHKIKSLRKELEEVKERLSKYESPSETKTMSGSFSAKRGVGSEALENVKEEEDGNISGSGSGSGKATVEGGSDDDLDDE